MSLSILFLSVEFYLVLCLACWGNCWLLLTCSFPSFMQAYDQHLNMILGDVEEVVTTVEIDDETYEEIVRVSSFAFLP